MSKRSWTDNQLIEACARSTAIRQVLKTLGLAPKGGSYKIIHNHIKRLGIDTSHFKGQGWLKNSTHNFNNKIPLAKILVEYSNYQSSNLRLRLLKEGLLLPRCYKCSNTTWFGLPIALELEHINGINTDNRLENLTLLCPNCHSQTSTYRGKNKKK